jgi:hypothetical protein
MQQLLHFSLQKASLQRSPGGRHPGAGLGGRAAGGEVGGRHGGLRGGAADPLQGVAGARVLQRGHGGMVGWLPGYPLVNVYIAMERSTIFNGKIHYFYGHFQ